MNKKCKRNYNNHYQMIKTFAGQDVHVRRMPPKAICRYDVAIERFYGGFEVEIEVRERIMKKYGRQEN